MRLIFVLRFRYNVHQKDEELDSVSLENRGSMTIEEHCKALAPKLTNWLVATGSPYAEACDLVQNTFLKIWKMKADLRDDDLGRAVAAAFSLPAPSMPAFAD